MGFKNRIYYLILALIASTTILLTACGGGSSSSSSVNNEVSTSESTGGIEAQVFNALTGEKVESAIVTVNDQLITANSDQDGNFSLNALKVGKRILKINKTGFAEQVLVVNIEKDQIIEELNIQLIPLETAGTVNPLQGGTVTLEDSTAQVTFQANSLRREDGQAIEGNVTVGIALIDVAQDVRRMPGDLAIYQGSTRMPLESFGAMTVVLEDSAGERVVLNDNATANIRIPLMTRGDAPDTVPLYYFDTTLGYWMVDGSQVLTLAEDEFGNFYYEGISSTLNTVNADIPYETTNVVGCIQDSEGVKIANASIVLEGIDYSGYTVTSSGSDGYFTIPARTNSNVIIGGQQGTLLSNTIEAETTTSQLNLPTCLVVSGESHNVKIRLSWGELPEDVDSHMMTPSGEHIYYEEPGNLLIAPYINLDVDDTDSYGPEIITINKLMVGKYNYFVDNFSLETDPGLFGSPIRVELNTKDGTQVFTPTSSTGESMVWHAFSLDISENCQITVTPVRKWLTYDQMEDMLSNSSTPQYCQS